MKKIFTALALALLLPSASALGWNHKGHMTVAYIAFQHLSPSEQKRVVQLLKSHPDYGRLVAYAKKDPGVNNKNAGMLIFIEAARWPDFIRSDDHFYDDTDPEATPIPKQGGFPDMKKHKPWHFLDMGFSVDETFVADPDEDNAGRTINAFRHAISSPDVDDTHKAYFLAWLEHVVGDVHQPLHCAALFSKAHKRGDRGGNLFELTPYYFSPTDKYPVENLHSFWDEVLGLETDLAAVGALAAAAEGSSLKESASDMNEADWVRESFGYARDNAYGPLLMQKVAKPTITPAYVSAARTLALQRVKLAGYRLAQLIHENLK